ncbi:MAG: PorP/SprF family type IX secretion system membrane protein [Saprospiraceae bacterium]
MRYPVVFTALLLSAGALTAQDLHFSQMYLHPLHYNPAQTGVFRGEMRAAGIYRSQWTSVPVSYRSFSGSVDWKTIRSNTNMLSVGLMLQHDRAGDASLGWTSVGATAGVTHALGKSHAISVGVGLALAQRSVDISKLKFKNQWTGELYDPSLPTGEQFDNNSGIAPTLSAGVNWHYEPGEETRTRFDAGVGAFHLNKPDLSLAGDAGRKLPLRMSALLNGALQVGEYTDVVAFAAAQRMSKAGETVFGAGLRRILSEETDLALQFTLGTRLGDALIPAFQIEWMNWTAGLSYDWNNSDFDVATGGRGGFEIAVVYRTLPVPPVRTFKSCPIF